MQVTAKYLRKLTNEDGKQEIVLELDSFRDKEVAKELVKNEKYVISFEKYRSKRSLEQNALMWEMIKQIAIHRGGDRGVADDWDIYVEALERAGVKSVMLMGTPEIEEGLKNAFRVVKVYNTFEDENGRVMNTYKCYYGSSKMDTKQMSNLLETVLDMASEEGIYPKDLMDLYA